MLVIKLLNVTSFANSRVSRKVVSSNFDIATYVVVLLCTGGDAGTVTCLDLCHDPSHVHRRVHNSRNLSHMNPVYAVSFYFFKIHLNIILTSAPTSCKCFPSFRIPHKPHTSMRVSSPPYVPRHTHFPWPDYQTSAAMKLINMQSSPVTCYFPFVAPHVLLSTLSLCSSFNVTERLHIRFYTIRHSPNFLPLIVMWCVPPSASLNEQAIVFTWNQHPFAVRLGPTQCRMGSLCRRSDTLTSA